jgi:hypothetical protein
VKLTINNFDGSGAVDYTGCIVQGSTFRIERTLNAPSLFYVSLLPSAIPLPVPARNARVICADDSGNLLFTGYVVVEPEMVLAGEATAGQLYMAELTAVSDDILLNRMALAKQFFSYGQSADKTMSALAGGLGVDAITTSLSTPLSSVGEFIMNPGVAWSGNAAQLADSSASAYRIVNGVLNVTPIGSVTHILNESDGTLSLSDLQASLVKALANDVTVCGETEPCAYVTEYFEGDGVTTLFDLTQLPYTPPPSKEQILVDLFQEPTLNRALWEAMDVGYISVTSNGLTSFGGNGADGSSWVAALGRMELGGSLILEANGVQLGTTTVGVLNGLYNGTVESDLCIAGFQVSQTSGTTAIAPLVMGTVSGTSFTPASGHIYTLRLRVSSNEAQRVNQSYYYVGDNGLNGTGGEYLNASVNVMLEVQDATGGVAGAPTILYEGVLPQTPAVATYAPLNSIDLKCSIASILVTQKGPAWVVSTPLGGGSVTRRIGTTAQGANCRIERNGKLRFYPTSVPQSGEVIAVSYRTRHRAVARLASSSSIASESAAGLPGTAAWIGTAHQPLARNSADCENAASALLAVATSRSAAWKGKYTGWNMEQSGDIWPGDLLAMNSTSAGLDVKVVVRTVQIDLMCSQPGLAKYTIQFANDWAEALAVKTSAAVPLDVWLPFQPQAVSPLANLDLLTATSVTSSQINVSANVAPPTGGGFEVRRRDWSFGPGTSSDLVLRSPVPNFIIPREEVMEQYYIRMYDGSTPPNYSRFSAAVIVNLPL